MLDLIIRNGLVVDGSGRPGRRGDVAVQGDEIVSVGRASADMRAVTEIDAQGKVVCPGFIDVHGHSDSLLIMDPQCDSKITQGITTDVGGNCGLSPGPYRDLWYVDWWVDNPKNFFSVPMDEGKQILAGHGLELDWTDLAGFYRRLEAARPALNYTGLIGHYVLRATAYGEAETQPWRQPTRAELDVMKALVREAMEQGARGISCAFHHTDPELDVPVEEFQELASVVAEFDGVFAFHLRSYTDGLLTAVREAIELAAKTGVRTTISHLWGDGKEYWGKVRVAMDAIEKARLRGIPIWCDVLLTLQPRNYMSGGLKTLFPDEVATEAEGRWGEHFAGSGALKSAARRMRAGGSNRWYKERFNPLTYWPMWDEMMRVIYSPQRPEFEGLMVYDLATELGCDSYEALCHLIQLNDGDADTMLERTDDRDIIDVLAHPVSMVGTDGSPVRPIRSPRPPNPRLYGTFPRLFAHFVRDKQALRLEEAVMKSTSMPAEFLGLSDRGVLRQGFKADIAVFDPATVQDYAHLRSKPESYRDYSRGVSDVIVNGRAVVRDGILTEERPGRVLRHG